MSKKKEDVVEQAPEVVEAVGAAPETLIYIGPTLPGIISHATIYRNGIPEHLQATAEKCPAIRSLMIPIEDLPHADKEYINVLSQAVLKWAAKKEG